MANEIRAIEELTGLDELVERHTRSLFETLARPHTLEEIEADVTALNDLLRDYKQRDALLEKLLDWTTPEDHRAGIRERLRAMRVEVGRNREELLRLREKSHMLIQRSVVLLVKAQRELEKRAPRHKGYAPELCGLCKGVGGAGDDPCPACGGKGTALVYQPAIKCPRCKGTGQPTDTDRAAYGVAVCLVCRGSGWAVSLNEE